MAIGCTAFEVVGDHRKPAEFCCCCTLWSCHVSSRVCARIWLSLYVLSGGSFLQITTVYSLCVLSEGSFLQISTVYSLYVLSGGVFLQITTVYTGSGSAFVVPSAAAKCGVEGLTKYVHRVFRPHPHWKQRATPRQGTRFCVHKMQICDRSFQEYVQRWVPTPFGATLCISHCLVHVVLVWTLLCKQMPILCFAPCVVWMGPGPESPCRSRF